MNRKWIVVQAVLLVSLSTLVLGCSRTPPPEPPPPEMPRTETRVEPATEVTRPADPTPVADPTPDPWAVDLQAADAMARDKGLLGAVYFDFDKASLKPEARQRLAENARFLNEHREFTVTIEGHCDERGTSDYNIALGERRANATLDYLASLGVSRSRLRLISYGEENPVCTDSTENCWSRNRRAYFKITGRS